MDSFRHKWFKSSIVMAALFSWLTGLLGCGKQSSTAPETATVFAELRQKVLTLDPTEIGLTPSASNRVWGVLMETAYSEAVVTLVTLADGTVSLYFSNGGGIIGIGGHDGPRLACEELISLAPNFVSQARPTDTFPLPKLGNTRFYFLTFDGVLTVEAKESDLGDNRLALSPFFHKAHEVITQARIVEEESSARRRN